MQQPRLLSFLFSLCLHAGVVAFALFLPQTTTPIADLSAPAIDVNIYTIGSPGKAPTTAPSAPKTPAAPVAPPQVRQDRPAAPVPVPDPARQRPET
ncbi:MAG: hypothetical protein LBV01_05010, partial [Deltaproteobacteria bacterium]|nr:hypothetical protein [Deltaproteobacteria bacterium]